MISLLLSVGVILLWRRTVTLRRRIDRLEASLARRGDALGAVATAAPTAAPTVAPPPIPPPPSLITEPTPAVAAPAVESPAPSASPPAVGRSEAAQGWEVVVGSSWLNKAGVLIFVTGLALLLGYSMAHVGPLGRVAMGFGIGTTMLAAGMAIERRLADRAYGHGLVAGGWAGIYVTTFAMRALPAARVIDSDLVATLLLLAVASAMVWHSLRYRSQIITSLAYLAASVPLGLTPLSTFSLIAALPLAVSLLVVSQRFGWSGLSLLGLGTTYILFALRASGVAALDLQASLRYVLLGTYWLTFEVADIITARDRPADGGSRITSLFGANAIGSIGCLLLLEPFDDQRRGPLVVAGAALCYLAAAVVRARLRRASSQADVSNRPFDTSHAALALSAALMAWAIGLRFEGPRLMIGLLLETQLLFVSALAIGDRQIRRVGMAVTSLVTFQALAASLAVLPAQMDWPWPMSTWTPWIALVAACWYANDELLRRRGIVADLPERSYTWVASVLVCLIITRDVPSDYSGLVAMVFALGLLIAGTRPAAAYRYQSYVVLFVGVRGVFLVLPENRSSSTEAAWPILLAAVTVAYAFGWWAARHRSVMSNSERQLVAIEAGTASVALLAAFEWRVVPRPSLGGTWAITAACLATFGEWRRIAGARWQAYALAAAATLRALSAIAWDASASTVWAGVAIGALFATGLVSRNGVRRGLASGATSAAFDRAARITVIVSATLLLTVLLADRLSANLITMSWGLEGIVLLVVGFLIRERVLRLSGLALLFLCILKLFVYDLRELEALGRIMSFVVLGLVLLGVSWTYTKYKEQLQKLL
ncbi:MAG: DUF2339 domain-containing protein [Acidobacteriota bacterium]